MNATQITSQIIGYAVADVDFDYAVPQEFAGACETVRIPAGRYPVELRRSNRDGYRYSGIRLEGVSNYRGWFGTNTRVETKPEARQTFQRADLYQIAACGKSYFGTRFELAAGFEARVVEFVSYDGVTRSTTGIFHEGEQLKTGPT
jgi:hypothetical protein